MILRILAAIAIGLMASVVISAICLAATPTQYQFIKNTYTKDGAKLELELSMSLSSKTKALQLNEKSIQKAIDTVAGEYTMEEIIGRRRDFSNRMALELNKLLEKDGITIHQLSLIHAKFTDIPYNQ